MRLRFGDHIFDSDTREVLRAGQPLAISPKAFVLLELLIESPAEGRLEVDIHSRLWPDTHVSEANLGNLVVELRAALGDEARRPRVIRTVARFGYAFIARGFGPSGTAGPRPRRLPSPTGWSWGRREIALEPGDNLIGRDRDAVVWIDDESVSRRHARIAIGRRARRSRTSTARTAPTSAGQKIRGLVALQDRGVVRIGPATLTLRVLKRTGSTRSTVKERSSQ